VKRPSEAPRHPGKTACPLPPAEAPARCWLDPSRLERTAAALRPPLASGSTIGRFLGPHPGASEPHLPAAPHAAARVRERTPALGQQGASDLRHACDTVPTPARPGCSHVTVRLARSTSTMSRCMTVLGPARSQLLQFHELSTGDLLAHPGCAVRASASRAPERRGQASRRPDRRSGARFRGLQPSRSSIAATTPTTWASPRGSCAGIILYRPSATSRRVSYPQIKAPQTPSRSRST